MLYQRSKNSVEEHIIAEEDFLQESLNSDFCFLIVLLWRRLGCIAPMEVTYYFKLFTTEKFALSYYFSFFRIFQQKSAQLYQLVDVFDKGD